MMNCFKLQALSNSVRWLVYPLAVCVAAAAVVAAPTPRGDLPSPSELEAAAQSIEARQKLVNARLDYKEALVRDLIADRASLREVAERFLEANREAPKCLDLLRMQNPGLSDLACCAGSAIAFAEAQRGPPAEARRLRDRLACEFAELVAE